jgi:hypothetical protein
MSFWSAPASGSDLVEADCGVDGRAGKYMLGRRATAVSQAEEGVSFIDVAQLINNEAINAKSISRKHAVRFLFRISPTLRIRDRSPLLQSAEPPRRPPLN